MNITIRDATPADVDLITEFNRAMARETEDLDLDRDRLGQGVAAVIENPAKGFYLIAEADGEAAGQMMITFEWSDWRNGVFWWIQSVYVKADRRGRGVYRSLYGHVLERARSDGNICGLRLYVENENQTAQTTYQRLGMNQAPYQMYEVDFVLSRSS